METVNPVHTHYYKQWDRKLEVFKYYEDQERIVSIMKLQRLFELKKTINSVLTPRYDEYRSKCETLIEFYSEKIDLT